jgi:IrrE N-terminal-like domain
MNPLRPIPTYLPKPTIQTLAEEFAEKQGFTPQQPLREVVEKLGGKIEYYGEDDLEKDRMGGSLMVESNRFTIKLSNFTGVLRDRFTVAHELGHYVLHSLCGQRSPMEADRHMPEEPSPEHERAEWEANWFAGAFLMSAKEVRKLQEQKFTIPQMAAHFTVSPKAMEIRLKQISAEPHLTQAPSV